MSENIMSEIWTYIYIYICIASSQIIFSPLTHNIISVSDTNAFRTLEHSCLLKTD